MEERDKAREDGRIGDEGTEVERAHEEKDVGGMEGSLPDERRDEALAGDVDGQSYGVWGGEEDAAPAEGGQVEDRRGASKTGNAGENKDEQGGASPENAADPRAGLDAADALDTASSEKAEDPLEGLPPPEAFRKARNAFVDALGDLGKHCEKRVGDLERAFERASAGNVRSRELVEKIWNPRFRAFREDLEEFCVDAKTKPSFCLMGKRGQGKTTLIVEWIGPKAPGGLEEIKRFPTGDTDTTAALVRITHEEAAAEKPLAVKLFSREDLKCLEERMRNREEGEKSFNRPPYPSLPVRFALNKLPRREEGDGAKDNLSQKDTYRVLRFPNDNKNDDQFRVSRLDEGLYALGWDGEEALTALQWYAKEVTVPVAAPEEGYAGRLLPVADIVDAPGADTQKQGEFGDWKERKNNLVFTESIDRLDALLLVASANTSGAQLGGQLINAVWTPWLKRCGARTEGRLLVVFSRAQELLKEAMDLLDSEEEDDGGNNSLSPARKIFGNVLDPLISAEGSFFRRDDAASWPPVFFFDKNDRLVDLYRKEGFAPGEGAKIAERLCALLDLPEIPRELPLGERCVLRIARDWKEWARKTAKKDLPGLYRWMVRSLCALLDPADRGMKLLTEVMEGYATGGPVARNYLTERLRGAEALVGRLRTLRQDVTNPASNAEALEHLRRAAEFAREVWKGFPKEPFFREGKECGRCLDEVQQNLNARATKKKPVPVETVLEGVVADALATTAASREWPEERRFAVKRGLLGCLQADMKRVLNSSRLGAGDLGELREQVVRIQRVALERLHRIVEFLATKGTEEALRRVAEKSFDIDPDLADLIQAVREQEGARENAADREAVARVERCAEKMTRIMDRIAVERPYGSER